MGSLASSRGSITWARLAVLRCAPLGIPIVPWLALLTASTLCVVLTVLASPRLGLTGLRVAVAVTAFTGAQVEPTGHACVACVTVLAGGATVTRGAGTMFYFSCWVLASVLWYSHVHADTREPALGWLLRVGCLDEEGVNACQGHQQVLPCGWLSIRPLPRLLLEGHYEVAGLARAGLP